MMSTVIATRLAVFRISPERATAQSKLKWSLRWVVEVGR